MDTLDQSVDVFAKELARFKENLAKQQAVFNKANEEVQKIFATQKKAFEPVQVKTESASKELLDLL